MCNHVTITLTNRPVTRSNQQTSGTRVPGCVVPHIQLHYTLLLG
jgi:hypothetical protein